MRLRNLRILNSFLLWFIVILLANYILLFAALRLWILKAPIEVIADMALTVNDATHLIYKNQGTEGLAELKSAAAERNSTFNTVQPDIDHEMRFIPFPGPRYLIKMIDEITEGTVSLHFSNNPSTTFWLTDKRHTEFVTQFQHKGQPFLLAFFIASFMTVFAISLLAAWWISRRLIGPLEDLSKQAGQLTDNKKISAIQLHQKNPPSEIAALANSLNAMREELDRTIKERESLLAHVTHDLRTPLSRLQIALDMMESSNPSAVQAMHGDIDEMKTILEQFVELSKLDAEVNEAWTEGDLNILVGQIRDQYRRAGVNLRTVLDENPVHLRYKPVALTRLLYNLIDNGCRHGSGSIEISVSRDGSDVLLYVRNPILGDHQGTGLTEAFNSDSQRTPTTGLGLSIVRQFAQVHQAELEESLENGVKTFMLRFKGSAQARFTNVPVS